jgi:hypothetical protein
MMPGKDGIETIIELGRERELNHRHVRRPAGRNVDFLPLATTLGVSAVLRKRLRAAHFINTLARGAGAGPTANSGLNGPSIGGVP